MRVGTGLGYLRLGDRCSARGSTYPGWLEYDARLKRGCAAVYYIPAKTDIDRAAQRIRTPSGVFARMHAMH